MLVMFQSNFDDLRREKALREKRDLSVNKVAAETGLSINTIQRVRIGDAGRVNLKTIETLMRYFEVGRIEEFIEYLPGEALATLNL
jgi:transcriptional regulator with XRE-family HTH domain